MTIRDLNARIPARLPYAHLVEGRHHRQVCIKHSAAGQTYVDAGMADLILACWRSGITTMHSCERLGTWWGNPEVVGMAYVGLPESQADWLLELAGSPGWATWTHDPDVYPELAPERYAYVYLPPGEIPEVTARLEACALLGATFAARPGVAAPQSTGRTR